MPIYEYVCTTCDHRADILHGINDPGPNYCPSCGQEGTMRKQFAAPAIHYKGSGWAKKDRGSSSRGARGSSTPAGHRTDDGAGSGSASGNGSASGDGSAASSGGSGSSSDRQLAGGGGD